MTGFASHIQHDQDSSTIAITGFTTFESELFTLGAELSSVYEIGGQETNFLGYSLFSIFKATYKLTLIGRIDWFNPDTNIEENAHFREIVGIGYRISESVELVLNYQGIQYDKDVISTDSNIVYVHLHFVF